MPRFVLRPGVAPEPTSRIALRWGDYSGRYLIGTALILAGAAIIVQTTAYTLSLGVLASIMHLVGWGIQPAKGWSRFLAAGPSLLCCWATLSGAGLIWMLSGSLGLWLLVRRRPPITAVVILLPFAVGLVMAQLFEAGADKTLVFWTVVLTVVVGAVLAREYALRVRLTSAGPKEILRRRKVTGDLQGAETP